MSSGFCGDILCYKVGNYSQEFYTTTRVGMVNEKWNYLKDVNR